MPNRYGPALDGRVAKRHPDLSSKRASEGRISTVSSARAKSRISARFAGPGKPLLLSALLLIILAGAAFGSASQIVTASVGVSCAFNITLNSTAPFYVQPQPIGIEYNVLLLDNQCTQIPSLTGTIGVENSITDAAYNSTSQTFSDVTTAPTTGTITFNSVHTSTGSAFPQSTDVGFASLSSGASSNTATSPTFLVVQPANIIISNFTASPSTATPGSSIDIDSDVTNVGGLAAINSTINIKVAQPGGGLYSTNYSIGNVPSQSGAMIESIPLPGSASTSSGTYTVTENVSYYDTYTQGSSTYASNMLLSQVSTTTYVIRQPGGSSSYPVGTTGGAPASGPAALPPTPLSFGQVSFAELPLLTSLLLGNSTIEPLTLTNTGQFPIWINLTTPGVAFGAVVLSTESLYLPPLQNASVGVFIDTFTNITAGTYYVPINMTVSSASGTPGAVPSVHGQAYIAVKVSPSSNTTILITKKVSIAGNPPTMSVLLQVYNPLNTTVYGGIVTVSIPTSFVQNYSDISAGGAPVTIGVMGDPTYTITWKLSELQPGGTQQLYYSIANITDPQAIADTPAVFSASTQPAPTGGGLRIIDITAPLAHVNSTTYVRVSALFTGQDAAQVTMVLSGPSDVSIAQPTQVLNAVPNGMLQAEFQVMPTSVTGTRLLHLSAYVGAQNQTFTVPMVVLPQSPAPTSLQVSAVQLPNGSVSFVELALAVAAFGIAVMLAARVWKGVNRARYDTNRSRKLIMLRQRIEREDGGPPPEELA